MTNPTLNKLIREAIGKEIRDRLIDNWIALGDFAKKLGISGPALTGQLQWKVSESKLEETAMKAGFRVSEIEQIKKRIITEYIDPQGMGDPENAFQYALKKKYWVRSSDPAVMADIDMAIRIALGKSR